MASSQNSWKTREDYKKQKELEEARKAGTALPETDEDGRDINPHIPQYIAQAPWYLDTKRPSLKHQRKKTDGDNNSSISDWYQRGVTLAPRKKFVKGACENCGATTHNTKSCVERPRKKGAKWTNQDIKGDEIIKELNLDFDGKRDRWNGYDSSNHMKVVEQFEKIEEERRKKKAESFDSIVSNPANNKNDSDSDSDSESSINSEFKTSEEGDGEYKEDGSASQITKVDPKTRTTIRNLRIREDTAKYLRNLDLSSAYYDPKTRSMRENPNPNQNPDEASFLGDNAIRNTGEFGKFMGMQFFAWEAYDKGQDVHIEAAPSQAELIYEQHKIKKEQLKEQQKKSILEKYGGEEHLNAIPKQLLYAQTEAFVEYSRDGKILNGREKVSTKSKYEEDVLRNNHTCIWGSYWENGKWGYDCCHQFVKNSYCTGEAGKEAKKESSLLSAKAILDEEKEEEPTKLTKKKTKKAKKESESDDDDEKDEKIELDERKRPYNSLSRDSHEVTEEEMERYHLKKARFDDPMRNFC